MKTFRKYTIKSIFISNLEMNQLMEQRKIEMYSQKLRLYQNPLAHHMQLYLASSVAHFARIHSLICQIRHLQSNIKRATLGENVAMIQMEKEVLI